MAFKVHLNVMIVFFHVFQFQLYFNFSHLVYVPPVGMLNSTMTGDMYVFAYTWTPEFCYGTTGYPGCSTSRPYWKNHYTLHGLWPEYSTGGYPQDCTTEAYDPSSAVAVGMEDMTQYWPEVEYKVTDPEYTSFWEHEWTKHGTCTGLSQVDYFQSAINLIKKFGTPQSLIDAANAGTSIDAATLRNDMGGASFVSLQCDSGKYLSGAYTCWAQSNGVPTNQVACPSDVLSSDGCTSSSVEVPTL
jgi:ribonuclease T2